MSLLPPTEDVVGPPRHVRVVPWHEVAALQPAAREQEPRGRQPVERTGMAGWQGQRDQLMYSNQCRPSIHQPTVDEFRMPAEMSIALSRAHLHARMHVASCWRRVHHRDRHHQHTIPIALAALPGAVLPATSCIRAFRTPAAAARG